VIKLLERKKKGGELILLVPDHGKNTPTKNEGRKSRHSKHFSFEVSYHKQGFV